MNETTLWANLASRFVRALTNVAGALLTVGLFVATLLVIVALA